MNAEEIIKLIEKLPSYLIYLYPGYISMFVFYYLRAITLEDTQAKIIKSIVLSYLYIALTKNVIIGNINKIFDTSIYNDIDGIGFNITILMLSILLPYLLYQFLDKIIIKRGLLKRLGIETSLCRNEIEVLQKKYHEKIWIYVYMRDSNIMYEGSLTEKELENSRVKFFCLSKYRKYLLLEEGAKKKLCDYSTDEKEKVLIYFDRISHFEIANVDKVEEAHQPS